LPGSDYKIKESYTGLYRCHNLRRASRPEIVRAAPNRRNGSLLRERICEPREASYAHSQIQILPFDITGRDVLPIRVSAQRCRANADARCRAVVRLRFARGCAIQLYQHRGIHVHPESTFDGFRVGAVAVHCDLNARGYTRC
jgi:hypothetical protein